MDVDYWDYWEEKTEVWVWATLAGYRCFRNSLQMALRKRVRISSATLWQGSMLIQILPAQRARTERACLRMWERRVYWQGSMRNELVLLGNRKGYAAMREVLNRLEKSVGDVWEHYHFGNSTDNSMIVAPSVELNIRAPIRGWDRNSLEEWYVPVSKALNRRWPDACSSERVLGYQTITRANSVYAHL